MSYMSHGVRRALSVGAIAAIAVLSASASPAQAANVPKTLTYTCLFPYVGPQQVSVTSDAIPELLTRNVFTGEAMYPLTAKEALTLSVEAWDGFDLMGVASAEATIAQRGSLTGTPFSSALTIPRTDVPQTRGSVLWGATGKTTIQGPLNDGSRKFTIDPSFEIGLSLFDETGKLFPRLGDDSDEDKPNITGEALCTLDPATQDRILGDVQILHADYFGPSAPTDVKASSISATSATLNWTAPVPYPGIPIVRYDVYNGATKLLSTTEPKALLTGLQPGTTYALTVKAIDSGGQASSPSAPITVITTPCPGFCTPYSHSFSITGRATLKTLVKGSLNLTGSLDSLHNYNTGQYSGTLKLNPANANLTAYGFLPVTAKVAIVPTTPATGASNVGTVISLATKIRVKLPSISLAGISLGGGAGCQTKTVSALNLARPAGSATLVGAFSISDLANCGALTNIVSSLTKGDGNAITFALTELADPPPPPPTAQ
jgi:hypothetical protein